MNNREYQEFLVLRGESDTFVWVQEGNTLSSSAGEV
jgi:hypothetical protein